MSGGTLLDTFLEVSSIADTPVPTYPYRQALLMLESGHSPRSGGTLPETLLDLGSWQNTLIFVVLSRQLSHEEDARTK